MFIEPDRQLHKEDRFLATLVLERTSRVDVEFMVETRTSAPADKDHSEHGGT